MDASATSVRRPLHGIGADFRIAARRLAATPLFFTFAVASLGVGIAVVTAMYSLLYAVFWKPSGVPWPERLAVIASGSRPSWQRAVSIPDFEDLRSATRSFDAIAASMSTGQSLEATAVTEIVGIEAVTADYFRALGAQPALGRLLDHTDAAAPVVVLDQRAWRRYFDQDPTIVGRTVRLGGQLFEVVGVAPESFSGLGVPLTPPGAWIPFETRSVFANISRPDRNRPAVAVVARLRPGTSLEQAQAELQAISRRFDAEHPLTRSLADGSTRRTPRRWFARPIDDVLGSQRASDMAMLVLALVCLVLLVACTNLANLMLARGTSRTRELAVRRALGASRWRLVRQIAAEGVLISVTGAVAGITLTRALLYLGTIHVPVPRGVIEISPELNLQVLAVAAGVAVLSMAVFGVEPALQLTRLVRVPDLVTGETTVGLERSRRHWTLIRWQVAVSVAFFLIAAVLLRVVLSDVYRGSGVDLDRLALASVHAGLQGWTEERARRTFERALEELRREPGVEAAAIATGAHFGVTMTPYGYVTTPDRPFLGNGRDTEVYVLSSTPEVFTAFGVPILRGRGFDHRDDAAAEPVAVISEHTARTIFGTREATGRQLMVQIPRGVAANTGISTVTVIGVAADTDAGRAMTRDEGIIYLPFAQHYQPSVLFVARTAGDPAHAARQIQSALRRADPELATGTFGPASMMMAGHLVMARIAGGVAAGLALLTLGLAMAGLYGVLATVVERRTREVGLRMALGGAARQIQAMVLHQGFKPVLQGLILGLLIGSLTRLALRALLIAPVPIVDPYAMLVVPIPLGVAAFAACYLPARRAARVSPSVALRHL